MPQNTIEILNSINQTVKQIAQSMKPQNGTGAAATAKLSQGDVTTNADVNPAANVAKSNVDKESITAIIGVLNGLTPSVKEVIKLSDGDVKRFTKVIDAVIGSINKLSETSKSNKESIEGVKLISYAISALVGGLNKAPVLIITAPLATLGLTLANFAIGRAVKIVKTVGDIKDDEFVGKAKLLSEFIGLLANGINKASPLAITAPLAISGLTVANFAIGRLIKIIERAGRVNNINDKVSNLNNIVKAIDQINKVIIKGAALFALCIGLGLIIEKAGSRELMLLGFATLGGIMLTVVGIVGITGLAARAIKSVGAIEAINTIMNIVFKATALVAICMALGYFIMNGPTKDLILGGLIALGGVLVVMTVVIGLTGLAALAMKKFGVFDGVKNIMLFTLASIAMVALCFGLGLAIEATGGIDKLLYGISAVALTLIALGVIFLITGVVGMIANSPSIRNGFIAIFLMTVASMALIVGMKYLGDFVLEHYDRILLGLGSAIIVMGALIGIGMFAGRMLTSAMQGIAALGVMELVVVGAAAVIWALAEVHKRRTDLGVTWDDISGDILAISAILVVVGALSAAASVALPIVAAGAAAIGVVELAILSTTLLSERLIAFHKKKEDSGVTWGDIELDILGMTAALGTFSALGSVVAVLSVPLLIATPAMAVLVSFSKKAINVVKSVVSLHKVIEEAGGGDVIAKTLSVDMPKIMSGINAKNFDTDMGILTMLRIAAKYKVMAELVSGVLDVAESISKIAKIMGMVDDQGRIRPIISKNILTGEVKYGEPVDLVNVATIIGDTVQKFVEGCQFSFRDVLSMYNAAEIFHVIGMITDPIAKFVDMLTGYQSSGEGMLAKITIDQQGNIKIGQPVKVADVATMIAGAVSAFVTELYKKENTEHWSELIYGDRTFLESVFGQTNKRADSVREIAGVLGVIMDPIVKFMDMITSLEADGNSMSKIIVDKDGNVKSGQKVDVFAVANSVANLISSFVGIIYDEKSGISNKSTEVAKVIEEVIKPIGTMIKSAEELSTDKINADLIKGNADAVLYANVLLIKSVSEFDLTKMTSATTSINELVGLGVRIGNELNKEKILSNTSSIVSFMKDVVEDRFPKNEKTINKFSESVLGLKKSFKELDDVLIKDDEKRKKALDDFEERLKKILDIIVGSKEALDTFNNTVTNVSNFQPTEWNQGNNTESQNTSYTPYAPGQAPEQQNTGTGNTGTIDTSELARAIVDGMKELTINPTNVPEAVGTNIADALLMLGKIGYTID